MNPRNPRILLDVDEVLVDFVGGALAAHGWTRKRLEAVHQQGTYSIIEPMGLTPAEFWKPINEQGEAFWINLKRLPWANLLLDLVRSMTDNWFLVSAPSTAPSSYAGKAAWVKMLLGSSHRLILMNHKQTLAKPNVILIDDCEHNVQRFTANGGEGIIFPSRHNSLWRFADDPLAYVEPVLREQCCASNIP